MLCLQIKKLNQRIKKDYRDNNKHEILNMEVEDNPQIMDRVERKDDPPFTKLRQLNKYGLHSQS